MLRAVARAALKASEAAVAAAGLDGEAWRQAQVGQVGYEKLPGAGGHEPAHLGDDLVYIRLLGSAAAL